MPTNRRRRAHSLRELPDELQRTHLEFGDCLLAGTGWGCLCGLRGADGEEDEEAIRAARKRLGIPDDDGDDDADDTH